ncbi:MAG: hypothetical protein V3U29_00075 [Phycisphaeraceae bacterium]
MRSDLSIVLAVTFVLAGCQTAKVAEPITAELAGNDAESRMAFWHTLGERSVVSNDEAWHGLLLFVDGEDPAQDYAGRVELLKARNMLTAGFDRPADEAVRRGDVAVAICRILEIKGGVIMRVFGPTPRYATRELEYEGLYLLSSPHQTLSGQQFLAIIGRVEDMQRVRGVVVAAGAQVAEPEDTEPPEQDNPADHPGEL